MLFVVFTFRVAQIYSIKLFDHSLQVFDQCLWSSELYKVVIVLSKTWCCRRIVLIINNPLFPSSRWNMGSIVVEFGRAIRIALRERLCGCRIKVHHIGWLSGEGYCVSGIDGGGWLLRCSKIGSLLNMVVIQNKWVPILRRQLAKLLLKSVSWQLVHSITCSSER